MGGTRNGMYMGGRYGDVPKVLLVVLFIQLTLIKGLSGARQSWKIMVNKTDRASAPMEPILWPLK